MDLACCHGNRYDVISALKVLPNNRVANIFIVFLHYEIFFFGIFHRFTNTIATEKPFRASLSDFSNSRVVTRTKIKERLATNSQLISHLADKITLLLHKSSSNSGDGHTDKLTYYIDTDEIPGFLLLLKNHIFTARSERIIFIFHM